MYLTAGKAVVLFVIDHVAEGKGKGEGNPSPDPDKKMRIRKQLKH